MPRFKKELLLSIFFGVEYFPLITSFRIDYEEEYTEHAKEVATPTEI